MTVLTPASERLRSLAERELAGEKLLWAGQPDARRTLLRGLPIWLFAVPWTALSLFWETIAVGGMLMGGMKGTPTAAGWAFSLFGLPFVLVGFGMLGAPFWGAFRASRSLHALTDRRLVLLVDGRKPQIKSFRTAQIVSVLRRDRKGGTGDIDVGFGSRRDSDGDIVEHKESLLGVPDAARLEALLIDGEKGVR